MASATPPERCSEKPQMKEELSMIDAVVEGLTSDVVAEVEAQASSVDPQFFAMGDIRRIITAAICDGVSSMSFARQLEVIATLPGADQAQADMLAMRFTLGEYVAAILSKALEERLLPLRYELTLVHYEGRIVSIMKGAGEFAAELIEGPASRCINEDTLGAYRADLDCILRDMMVPPEDLMDRLLCRGCEFFSPLDNCLERPEWGEPVGISEATVGHTAAEVRAWFHMLGDLQHLNLRRPMDFSQALAEELSAMPFPTPHSA
jgi:hypothetical protein